ncbi:MAG: LacI family DNA-binding transcriptional regulator [Dermabacter sp.]|nr:LacI family DNA-binding transcriptional regulator [Dermabacter sp.]
MDTSAAGNTTGPDASAPNGLAPATPARTTPGASARPTLATIARATGVSVQTVSNVVNGRAERVAPATRARIAAEIDRQGYRPNRAARLLRTHRSGLLGYRIRPTTDGINGSVLDRLLHALSEQAHARGYGLIVFSADDDDAEIEAYRTLTSENNVDGFLLTSTNHGDERADWLRENSLPFVAFGRPWGREDAAAARDYDWVDVDGSSGTRRATDLLLARGCTRVAFLGWPEGSGAGDDRRAGWDAALADAGIEDRLERRVSDSVDNGHEAAVQLVADGADAIVCASDSLAIGALVALRAARPELAEHIVGFDDTPVAAAVGLTSVNQPIEAAAARMIDLLVERIENPGGRGEEAPERLLPPVIRERTPLRGFTPSTLPTPSAPGTA